MSTATTQVGAIARRSVVRTSRQPASIIPPLIFPVALMAVNAGGLRSSTELPGFPTDSFLAFALAVPFIQGALFSTMNAGTDIARDVQTGFVNRLSLTALRDWALLSGQLAGIVVLGVLQVVFYIVVGLAAGVRFESGPAGIAVLLVYGAMVALSFGALGAWLAYRTGSGETIQALFPVLFVFLFISSMNAPRNLIERRLVPDGGDAQPGLVHDRVRPQPDHHGLGLAGARARVRLRDRARGRLVLARLAGAADADDEDVTAVKTWNVIWGVARRTLKNALTNPQILLPTLMFPLFFFVAFAGGLSQVAQVPGFDFPPGYTAFQFVFVLLQSAAFSGVFTGFGVARDFEGGFAKRLMLAAPRRSGIVLGYALAALLRWSVVAVLLTVIAFVAGMNLGGGAVDLVGPLHARGARELLRLLLVRRDRDALPHDPGGAADADARLPDPVLRARLRAARAPAGMDPRRGDGQSAHVHARDGPRVRRGRRAAHRGRVRDRARPRPRVLGLGLPRAAERRGRGRLESAQDAQERVDDLRVELRPRSLDQAPPRLLLAERPAVRAVGRHRVVRVAGEDDPRLERDLLADEVVGVARAVVVLVGAAHDEADLAELLDRREDALAEDRVRLDERALLGGERARLREDA